ncbi:MAG: tetratricopeptide repeat protein [Planctomycetota bacterium]|jgi:tetratricopeptide (TPR) repeat protein
MRTWIIVTIYLGTIAGLYGVSPAAQDDVGPSGVLQKGTLSEDSLQHESAQPGRDYRDLRRQLMWDQVESVEVSSDPSEPDKLDDLIYQLRSLKIPSKLMLQEPNEPTQSQTDTASELPLPEESQIVEESKEPVPENNLVVTLEKLDTILSPLQLADVLYRQGYYELAFKNYCTVYEQLPKDSLADRQWILFQKGNCCRYSDPDKAALFYNELINSFPNSRWTASANSRLKMIQWTQANQIKDLLEVEANDPNSP